MDRKFTEWGKTFDGRRLTLTVKVKAPDNVPGEHVFYVVHPSDPLIQAESASLVELGALVDQAMAQASQIEWTPYLYVDANEWRIEMSDAAIGVHRKTGMKYYRHGWWEQIGEPTISGDDVVLIPDTVENRSKVEALSVALVNEKAHHKQVCQQIVERAHRQLGEVTGSIVRVSGTIRRGAAV